MRKYLARVKRSISRSSLRIIDHIFQTDYYWKNIFSVNGYHDNQFKFNQSEIAFVHIPKTGGTSFYKIVGKPTTVPVDILQEQ